MTSGIVWENPPPKAFARLVVDSEAYFMSVAYQLAQFYAPQIEAWMKENAPWTDRTGNARQGLYTAVEKTEKQVVLILSHGVLYGIFLEWANAGSYSIIPATLDTWFPRLLADLKRVIE
jgi:hypothetical protein